MSSSKTLLYFCFSFIGGIFIASFFNFSLLVVFLFIIFSLISIGPLWEHKRAVVFGFCLLFLVLGIWSYQYAEAKIENSKLGKFNDLEQEITLIGKVSKEPDLKENNTELTVKVQEIQTSDLSGERRISIKNNLGKTLVTTKKYPQYRYEDRLKIAGFLKTPQVFEGFNYKNYLAKDGIYSLIYNPQIELLKKEDYQNPFSIIYAQILNFRNRLMEQIYKNISPQESSILGAIILGDKSKMEKELKNKLNITGVRHITAVSGMHVVILSGVLMSVLIGLGLWRQQAFYFTMIFIWLFIAMTGFQPSAIRAGIMGSLLLLAQQIGRQNIAYRSIVFAAAGMLAQNPLLLRLDVGFQLSFLAAAGIIYLGPYFRKWLKKIPKILNLREILTMTFSAQIFTLPILIYNFGYFSLVSPIANILIVPLLPLIMVLGFIFSSLGIVFPALGWLLSLPCSLFLMYLTSLINFFSEIPLSAIYFKLSPIWIVMFYCLLIFVFFKLQQKSELDFFN